MRIIFLVTAMVFTGQHWTFDWKVSGSETFYNDCGSTLAQVITPVSWRLVKSEDRIRLKKAVGTDRFWLGDCRCKEGMGFTGAKTIKDSSKQNPMKMVIC